MLNIRILNFLIRPNTTWNLCDHLLDTTQLSVEHSAVNLADELEESLCQWNLDPGRLVAVTTDNARNIVNAVESLD